MIIVVDDPDEFLEHFGVKGMQWGVRRQERRIEKSNKLSGKIDVLAAKRAVVEAKIAEKEVKLANPSSHKGLKVGAAVTATVAFGPVAVATIGVGSLFVRKYLKSNGRTKLNPTSNEASS